MSADCKTTEGSIRAGLPFRLAFLATFSEIRGQLLADEQLLHEINPTNGRAIQSIVFDHLTALLHTV